MTLIPCQKCGQQLTYDSQTLCSACKRKEMDGVSDITKNGLKDFFGQWAFAIKTAGPILIVIATVLFFASGNGKTKKNLIQEQITHTVSVASLPGTQEEAEKLVNLILAHPNRSSYQLTLEHRFETTLLECNLEDEILHRAHIRPGKKITHEFWEGYVMPRLHTAAMGGSLNDTPNGKIPGSFSTE